MEDYELHPNRRVFHLDEECYVLYLGRDTDDYKPFLRVGTARDLPSEVRPLVYSVVVTDLLPGSPLQEQNNLPPPTDEEFRYIGDPDTVERFKTYLHHSEIPTVGYQEAHEELEEQGAYAYFYDDGNLRLKFNKSEVFNLKRREEQDRHYPQRAREMKKLYLKNRIRYPRTALDGAGFLVAAGTTYLFSKGRVAALGTNADYFRSLAEAGIDPDRVASIASADADEGLVRLLKRIRGTGRLRIVSTHPDAVRPICELFAGDGKLALSYEITKLSREKYVQLLDFRIRAAGEGYQAERGDSTWAISVGTGGSKADRQGPEFAVDAAAGTWRFRTEAASSEAPLLEGTAYHVLADPLPEAARLRSEYLPPTTAGQRSDALSRTEDVAAAAISEFFRLAAEGGDAQSGVRNVKTALDNVDSRLTPLFWMYHENARSLARYLSKEEGPAARAYQQLVSALLKAPTPPEGLRLLPVVADVYIGPQRGEGREEGAVVLYRLTAGVSADSFALAASLSRDYAEATGPSDPTVFDSERERLYDLLASLDVVKARIPKAERTEAREREEATKHAGDTGADATVAAPASGEPGAPGKPGAGKRGSGESRGSRRARRKRTLAGIAAAVVVLVLIGLAYLFLGPGLPGGGADDVAQAAESDSGAESGAAHDGEAQAGAEAGSEGTDGEADAESGTESATAAGEGTTDEAASEQPTESGIPGLEPRETADGITITILDIIEMANRIAVDNGYRPMGGPESAGPNPDWIYPGNVFTLPDGATRRVVEGDTIWDIAADFIERKLGDRYGRYLDIMASYEDGDADREEVIEQLVSLRESTYAENFESLVQESIEEVREGQ